MSFHIHTGPGHHDRILVDELTHRKYEFTYTNYHPEYRFSKSANGETSLLKKSIFYNLVRWLFWGMSGKLSFLKKHNRHLNFIYPVYDFLSSLSIPSNTSLLFTWAQVSLISMKKVKRQGGIVVLDYPIPHILKWQQMLEEESSLANIAPPRSLFSKSMVNRMVKEIEIADYISVPSSFVANSFLEFGVAKSKLIFNSYGIDATLFVPKPTLGITPQLTIIFVGSIEYRKGVHYLLQAMDLLEEYNVELRVIGTVHAEFENLYGQYKNTSRVKWLGQLPKTEVVEEIKQADIMVMPSILEGLSLTILEAMACGVPVISTTNAGGAGVVEDYQEGFVIPIRDPSAISEKVKWCMENREEVKKMGVSARSKSINYYCSTKYVDRFVNKILSLNNE